MGIFLIFMAIDEHLIFRFFSTRYVKLLVVLGFQLLYEQHQKRLLL